MGKQAKLSKKNQKHVLAIIESERSVGDEATLA